MTTVKTPSSGSTEPMIRMSKFNEKTPSHFEDINKVYTGFP